MSPLTAPQRRVAPSRPARARRAATKSPGEKQQNAAQNKLAPRKLEAADGNAATMARPGGGGYARKTILKLSEKNR